jgi:PAS domain S-box-containing protein
MAVPCWYSDSKTLIIKGANSDAIKLFGYSAAELIGISFPSLFAATDVHRVFAIRKEEKWGPVGSFTFVRKDGSTFSAGIRWHQGEYQGTTCDCFIITEIDEHSKFSNEEECECNPPAL